MKAKTSRRDYLKSLPAIFLATGDEGWIDKDGDGEYLDDLFGEDETEAAQIPVAVGPAKDRSEIDSTDVKMYFALSGVRYEPDGDGGWQKIPSTGSNPAFESITDASTGNSYDVGTLASGGGSSEWAVNNDGVLVPVDDDPVGAGRVEISETLAYDYSQEYPHRVRDPEQSGPPTIQPHPDADNPVLTGTDAGVDGVADPFFVYDSGVYHMFFEEITTSSGAKDIGRATSVDGLNWTYQETILTQQGYSYPLVFKWQGTWYMTPTEDAGDVKIYQADSFPGSWSVVETSLTDSVAQYDPTPVFWNGRWYLFTYDGNDDKRLWYADSEGESITGLSWTEHPASPIITGTAGVRNGGRPIVKPDYIDMVYQDQDQQATRLFRVTDLTTSSFSQTEVATSPLMSANGYGWQASRAHHADLMAPESVGSGLVAVDGRPDATGNNWQIGIYTQTATSRGISDWKDVAGSRAASQEYQNQNAYPLELGIFVEANGSSPNQVSTTLAIGNSSGLSFADDRADRYNLTSSDRIDVMLKGVVPPGGWYTLSLSGNESIVEWKERLRRD